MELLGDVLMRMNKAECNYFVTELVRKGLQRREGPTLETRSGGFPEAPPEDE
jgi:hypothetical protein